MSANLDSAAPDLSSAAPVADLTGFGGLDGGLLDTFGIEAPTSLETPLPADAAPDAGAVTEKPNEVVIPPADVPDKTVEPVADQAAIDAAALAAKETPAEPAAVVDPDLSPEDKRLVEAMPEADRAEGARRLKGGSFYGHFKNPDVAIAGSVDELYKQSASRAAEMQSEFVARAVKDPVAFAKDYYARDPEGYGQFVSTIFNGDAKFFAREFTGREDVTPEQVRTALEFHDRHKDSITEDAQTELSEAELKDIDDTLPEVSAKIKSILAQPTKTNEQLAAAKQEIETAKAELDKLRGSKEQEQNTAAQQEQTRIRTEQKAIEDETYSLIETGLVRDLIDAPVAKGGLGLAITDAEKTSSPEVAQLKSVIRGLLLKGGLDDLPGFERGFSDWGKPQEEFTAAGKQWSHFVNVREKHNAAEVTTDKLYPLAKTYFSERSAHPTVKFLMNQLETLTNTVSQPPPPGEVFVPGRAPAVAKTEPQSVEDFLDSFTPVRT